jgi:Ca-activated chloride channel family protein
MGVIRRFALASCCLVALHAAPGSRSVAYAQSAPPPALALASSSPDPLGQISLSGESAGRQTRDRSMRVSVNMVLVPVSVTDMMNRPVLNLQKDDFSLFQDEQPQKLEFFTTEDAPISVGLLLDLSKSMTSKFDMERAAVSEFFRNANEQDDYFVITFADRPKLVTGATQSIDTIQSNLAMQTPDGNTAMFDAISEGADRMRAAKHGRKALLIISDGGDNHSRHHMKQIKKLLQDSDVEVYAIGIFDIGPFKTVEEALGRKWLSQITDATGGRTLTVDNKDKVPGAAAAISREIRNRYVLGYRPIESQTAERRKIRVQVASAATSSAIHAHYKSGYTAGEAPASLLDKN